MTRSRAILAWIALGLATAVPLAVAASSPLLAYRTPIYIAAGLAGVVAMGLLLVQPLLAGGYMPSLATARSRRLHRTVGLALVAAVLVHVGALWITSPPDVIDVLLLRSPTPFSLWGVAAMWAVLAAALLAVLRHRLRIAPRRWRLAHTTLAIVTVVGSAIHAMLIEGTMGTVSKAALCAMALGATAWVVVERRAWASAARRR